MVILSSFATLLRKPSFMERDRNLVVKFSGLKDGLHQLEFAVDKKFFESYPQSEICDGSVLVHLNLTKSPQMLVLEFNATGAVTLECDRCIGQFQYPVQWERKMVVNLHADEFADDDDLISLPESAVDLYIGQYVYEFTMLSLPARKVCDEAGSGQQCDPEVIAKLMQVEHKQEENPSDDGESDPRWQALKNIKFEN